MKRITSPLAILLTLLCFSIALANPVIPGYINELFFSSGSWTMEMDQYLPDQTLDGWTLSSHSGTSAFRPGIRVGNHTFTLITPDSLAAPLRIDPTGDSVAVNGPNAWDHYSLVFGTGPTCSVQAPLPGWSIARGKTYYLDQSPTLGAPNDTAGAMASISGIVLDSATHAPLPGALIEEWVSFSECTTGDSGRFSLRLPAHNLWLAVTLPGYRGLHVDFSLTPGQMVDTVLHLSSTTNSVPQSVPPSVFFLLNYPNPFNPSTTISFALPSAGKVTLDIYDALGREITELVRGVRPAGEYRVVWNGTDDNGKFVGSGIYLARLRVHDATGKSIREKSIKLLLVR